MSLGKFKLSLNGRSFSGWNTLWRCAREGGELDLQAEWGDDLGDREGTKIAWSKLGVYVDGGGKDED